MVKNKIRQRDNIPQRGDDSWGAVWLHQEEEQHVCRFNMNKLTIKNPSKTTKKKTKERFEQYLYS